METNKKGAIELDTFGYLAIAVLVLLLGLIAYLILSGKLTGIAEYIKNLFRLRGA